MSLPTIGGAVHPRSVRRFARRCLDGNSSTPLPAESNCKMKNLNHPKWSMVYEGCPTRLGPGTHFLCAMSNQAKISVYDQSEGSLSARKSYFSPTMNGHRPMVTATSCRHSAASCDHSVFLGCNLLTGRIGDDGAIVCSNRHSVHPEVCRAMMAMQSTNFR